MKCNQKKVVQIIVYTALRDLEVGTLTFRIPALFPNPDLVFFLGHLT